jgi:prophage regulatory protein
MAIRNMLRGPAVEVKTGLKKSALYAEMQRGSFPRPVKISAQAVAWFEDEVEAWQQQRERSEGGWCPRSRKAQRELEGVG